MLERCNNCTDFTWNETEGYICSEDSGSPWNGCKLDYDEIACEWFKPKERTMSKQNDYKSITVLVDGKEVTYVKDIQPKNLQEAVIILQRELQKHTDLYDAFRASIQSAIKDAPKEIYERDLAELILKRIIGEG